jgi:hypothetical protein
VATLTHPRGTKREARKEGAQLHGQLSVSEVEGGAARAEVVQAPAQQAHQAERAAQEVERLQRRITASTSCLTEVRMHAPSPSVATCFSRLIG